MNPVLLAVRTVSETDDVRVIEGLAYPFRGRDTYGTFFSARTDYHWDLFPDAVVPLTAQRADGSAEVIGEARFIRPVTYHHGFDADYGLARVGGWSPTRMDDDGIWVRAQINKRERYYETRLKPLLDANALGLSGGSAEHSVRIDQKSGEVLDWPAYELALTPVESNPLAAIAMRAGEALRIVAAVRGWLPEGTTQGDLDDGDFAWLASDKSLPDSERRKLPYKIHGKVNEDGWKAAWSRANQDGTDFAGGPGKAAVKKKLLADKPADVEVADAAKAGIRAIQTFNDIVAGVELSEELPEAFDTLTSAIWSAIYATDTDWNPLPIDDKRTAIQTSLDQFRDYILGLIDDTAPAATARAFLAAMRAGRRNSASDETALNTAHDSIATVLGMDCAPGDASARSGEDLPAFRFVAEPERPDLALAEMATRAAQDAAAEAVRRLTG